MKQNFRNRVVQKSCDSALLMKNADGVEKPKEYLGMAINGTPVSSLPTTTIFQVLPPKETCGLKSSFRGELPFEEFSPPLHPPISRTHTCA